MLEPVNALNHAGFEGLVTVEECGLQGMITLRGDLSNRSLKAGAAKAGGAKMPARGHANVSQANGAIQGSCWMSPDEVLILCPYDEVGERLAALDDKLGKKFALAVNVSDARAMFRLCGLPDLSGPSGVRAREVLARLCPVDLSPDAFKPGMFRRTRMAQVPAAFWMDAEGCFHIICFRSVAQYVFDLLKTAAAKGPDVGYFGTK